MRNALLATAALFSITVATAIPVSYAGAQDHTPGGPLGGPSTQIWSDVPTPGSPSLQIRYPAIKTRLDHFSGTQWVLVISYLPSEITSITCDSWTMLGIKSWHDQNDFTIPAGPSIAVMNANKFNGYCKTPGSIIAHTDDGDFVGTLDRGDGNWSASTKLTFKSQ